MMASRTNKKGFSAIEMTIATVIVGILTAIVVPQLPKVIENQRVKGAEKTLYDIYCAQKRYFINNGAYASATNQLDTTVKTPSGFTINVANNASQLGTLSKGSYSLVINSSGTINCSGSGCSTLALNNTASGGMGQPGGEGTCNGGNNGNGTTTDPGTTVSEDPGTVGTQDPNIEDPGITVNPNSGETVSIATDPEVVVPDPTYNQELSDLYQKTVDMYKNSPDELAKWIEANPKSWQQLLETYPDLSDLLKKEDTGEGTAIADEKRIK